MTRQEVIALTTTAFAVISAGTITGGSTSASETVTYTYDARGRLIKVTHAGSVNNNVATNYSYDKADNRANRATTGAPK